MLPENVKDSPMNVHLKAFSILNTISDFYKMLLMMPLMLVAMLKIPTNVMMDHAELNLKIAQLSVDVSTLFNLTDANLVFVLKIPKNVLI